MKDVVTMSSTRSTEQPMREKSESGGSTEFFAGVMIVGGVIQLLLGGPALLGAVFILVGSGFLKQGTRWIGILTILAIVCLVGGIAQLTG